MGLLTQIFAPHLERQSGDVIDSVYGLSRPSKEELEQRDKKVEDAKVKMGNHYLLAKDIKRKVASS